MKKIIAFLFLFSFSPTLFSSSQDLEEVIKKIDHPDHNVVMALKDLQKSCEEFHRQKESPQDFEQLVRVCESTSCLDYFSIELKKEKYKEALSLLKERAAHFDSPRVNKLLTNPQYQAMINAKIEKITESGMKNCHFEIDLNALSIPKIAKKKDKKEKETQKTNKHFVVKCPLVP